MIFIQPDPPEHKLDSGGSFRVPEFCGAGACFRKLSGKEIFTAAAYDEEVLFTVNYRNDVTTACYVGYGGVKYAVTCIDTFEECKQDIALYCKRQ